MKKAIIYPLFLLVLFTGCEDFLDYPPTTGLSNDKLTDIPAMQALIYGAYDYSRSFNTQSSLYSIGMVRDVKYRWRAEYAPFYDHQVSTGMTSWMFTTGFQVIGQLNTVAVSNVEGMDGTTDEKNAILGDMHFLKALVYFDLNNYFTLPSTGLTIPLLFEPVTPSDRVSAAKTEDVRAAVEADIEMARSFFETVSGVAGYYAATALAARIYFYHGKYGLAYERANEVIESGQFIIESDVARPFEPGITSKENIFSFKYNSADGGSKSPVDRLFNAYRPDELKGFYSLNADGKLAELVLADKSDARYQAFYTESGVYTYIDGKYSTDQMDFHYIRLAEMYLTRAESNIMVNNSVSQQDVDDINTLRQRAKPSSIISSIPGKEQALDIIFEDRTKELAIELGDHYLNTKRLEKGIIRIQSEGTGMKPYGEYADLLTFPFPDNEVDIHGLSHYPNE